MCSQKIQFKFRCHVLRKNEEFIFCGAKPRSFLDSRIYKRFGGTAYLHMQVTERETFKHMYSFKFWRLCTSHINIQFRRSAVRIETRVANPGTNKSFSSPKRPGPPSFLFNGGFIPRVQRPGCKFNHSTPCNAEVKNGAAPLLPSMPLYL
jgi:hypothetical protein